MSETYDTEIISATLQSVSKQQRTNKSPRTAYEDFEFNERRKRGIAAARANASPIELPQIMRPHSRQQPAECFNIPPAVSYNPDFIVLTGNGIPRNIPITWHNATSLNPPLLTSVSLGGATTKACIFWWENGIALTDFRYSIHHLLCAAQKGFTPLATPISKQLTTTFQGRYPKHDYICITSAEPLYLTASINHLEQLYPRSNPKNIYHVPTKIANALLYRNFTQPVPINLGKFTCLTHLLGVGKTKAMRYMSAQEYYYHFALYDRLVQHGIIQLPNFKNYQVLKQNAESPNYSTNVPVIDTSIFPDFSDFYNEEAPCYS